MGISPNAHRLTLPLSLHMPTGHSLPAPLSHAQMAMMINERGACLCEHEVGLRWVSSLNFSS